MNPDSPPNGAPLSSDEIDPGEPIEVLTALGEQPAPGFLDRIRSSIHRRVLASDVLELSFTGSLNALLEYLKMVMAIFQRPDRRGEGERE